MKPLRSLLCAVFGAAAITGCSNQPIPLASHVDLDRYSGHWFIIANIPYFAERGKVGSSFDLAFQGDKVTDIYTGYKSFGDKPSVFTLHGKMDPGTNNAEWHEGPFWPLSFPYPIVYVDPDYRTALVGYPDRKYGWVLARSPEMDDATYNALLSRFAAIGYDASQFRRVPQTPAEIGQPGYQ